MKQKDLIYLIIIGMLLLGMYGLYEHPQNVEEQDCAYKHSDFRAE